MNATWRRLRDDYRRDRDEQDLEVPEPLPFGGLIAFAVQEIARAAYSRERAEPWWTDLGGEA